MIAYKHCPLIPTLIFIFRIKQYLKASETFQKCLVAVILLKSVR